MNYQWITLKNASIGLLAINLLLGLAMVMSGDEQEPVVVQEGEPPESSVMSLSLIDEVVATKAEEQIVEPVETAQAEDLTTIKADEMTPEVVDQPDDVEPEPEAMARCYRVGPLRSEEEVEKLQVVLQQSQLNSIILSEDPGVVLGHWVFLPPERSLALARLKLEELKTKGLRDVALVVKAEPKYAISLGVFRNKLTARKRLKQIRAMGYEPELSLRYQREPETWLLVETEERTEPTEAGWNVLLEGFEQLEYHENDC